MVNLAWEQILSWRMAQQFLQPRAAGARLKAVVAGLAGVQAQLMSAAEIALGVRVAGLTPEEVRATLWKERSLVKTWAMRGTLHLVLADDLPLITAARQAFPLHRTPSYYRYHGVTPEENDAIIEGVTLALSDEPQTREQLAQRVAELTGMPGLHKMLLSGWGALLKPSAFRGDLCFGPSQGQNVTFVKPQAWLGEWHAVNPQQAIQAMVRRYLNAFGPASPADFTRWFGLQGEAQAKKVFKALQDELEEVDVSGEPAWVLKSSLDPIRAAQELHGVVRLLPQFDAYTLGVARDGKLFPAEVFRPRVYRAQGWISAVVLVDGQIVGVWELNDKGLQVRVELFSSPSAAVRAVIGQETQRLGEFLSVRIDLVFE